MVISVSKRQNFLLYKKVKNEVKIKKKYIITANINFFLQKKLKLY